MFIAPNRDFRRRPAGGVGSSNEHLSASVIAQVSPCDMLLMHLFGSRVFSGSHDRVTPPHDWHRCHICVKVCGHVRHIFTQCMVNEGPLSPGSTGRQQKSTLVDRWSTVDSRSTGTTVRFVCKCESLAYESRIHAIRKPAKVRIE